jgi:hypothetical protein
MSGKPAPAEDDGVSGTSIVAVAAGIEAAAGEGANEPAAAAHRGAKAIVIGAKIAAQITVRVRRTSILCDSPNGSILGNSPFALQFFQMRSH